MMKARNNDHRFWDTCVVDSCAYYLCSLGNEQATCDAHILSRTYDHSHVTSTTTSRHIIHSQDAGRDINYSKAGSFKQKVVPNTAFCCGLTLLRAM